MSLTAAEQAMLNMLQQKASANVDTAPRPISVADEVRRQLTELGVASPINEYIGLVKNAPPIPTPDITPTTKELAIPPASETEKVISRLKDIVMAAATPEQLGRILKLGIAATSQHGVAGAQKMLSNAGFNFLESPEGGEFIRLGIEAFFGMMVKADSK